MVLSEDLICFICKSDCVPDFRDRRDPSRGRIAMYTQNTSSFCVTVCGECRMNGMNSPLAFSKDIKGKPLEIFNAISYLAFVAPKDELKRLIFGRWNPDFCPQCKTPKRFLIHKRFDCQDCGTFLTPTDVGVNKILRGIQKEVSVLFQSVPRYMRFPRKCSLSVSDFFPCYKCKKTGRQFAGDGILACRDCPLLHPLVLEFKSEEMMWKLTQLVRCIPDLADLRLLTYSKWTPFRCASCSVPFSNHLEQAPYLHTQCERIACRSCFAKEGCCGKNGGAEFVYLPFILSAVVKLHEYFVQGKEPARNPAPAAAPAPAQTPAPAPAPYPATVAQSAVKRKAEPEPEAESPTKSRRVDDEARGLPHRSENYDQKTIDTAWKPLFSPALRCACGRVDEVAHFFSCSTCSCHGFCVACLSNDHWNHETRLVKPSMIHSVVKQKSTATFRKILSWLALNQKLDEQSNLAFSEVTGLLGDLYQKALNSEDSTLVEQLLAESDLSFIADDVERLAGAKYKIVKQLHAFRDRLKAKLSGCNEDRSMDRASPLVVPDDKE